MKGNRFIWNDSSGRASGDNPAVKETFQPIAFPGEHKIDNAGSAAEKKGADKLDEGKRLFGLGLWDKALQEFLLVDAGNCGVEERTDVAYYMGLCCAKLERFDDALLYFEQVVTAGGDVLRAYQCRMTIAYIYVKTSRPKMAEFELNRLKSLGFESASLYNTLAYAAYAQKHYKRAIDFYEKTLDIDQNNATALNSMGYILADMGIDVSKGLRYCRKAVNIKPDNAAYLDSLGWAHYKCGDMADAQNWLRRAADIAPHVKEIMEHYKAVSREAL